MSQPGQDPSDAEDAFNDFVNDQVNATNQALNGSGSCRKLKKAIAALGSAVHAAADNHSPQHSGFQEWDGLGHAITHPGESGAHTSGENLDFWTKNDEQWNESNRRSTLDDLNSRFGPLIDRIMKGCK